MRACRTESIASAPLSKNGLPNDARTGTKSWVEGAPLKNFLSSFSGRSRGMLGTWVKIPSLETVELLGHAGFEFVVIDMEHAPHSMSTAYELIFAAQACGMAALVRLPDQSGSEVQRLLDGGADGLLVPRHRQPRDGRAHHAPDGLRAPRRARPGRHFACRALGA